MKSIEKGVFLSVIIPVYNCEKYIERCISSILEQKMDNYEIIIVNDGSIDNTKNVLKKYKDNKIFKIIDIENSGVSVARNIGIENASGEYITFVDADDYIDTHLYKSIEKVIKSSKDIIDLIKIPIRYVYPNGVKKDKVTFNDYIKYFSKEQYEKNIYNFYLKGYDLANAVCFWFRKKNIENIRFDKNIGYGEDLLFCFNCIKISQSILFLNSSEKYNYYIYNNSSSRIKNKEKLYKNYVDAIKVYKAVYEGLSYEEFPERDKLKLRFLCEIEITLRKLTVVYKLREFLEVYKHLCEDTFFLQCLRYYKQNYLCYNRKMFILYKVNEKIYYLTEKTSEKIKNFIKQYFMEFRFKRG